MLSLETNLFNLRRRRAEGEGPRRARRSTGGVGRRLSGHPVHARSDACRSRRSIERSVTEDLPVNGVYRAGSDHRKDGQAVGLVSPSAGGDEGQEL